jgi:hypothetical protein
MSVANQKATIHADSTTEWSEIDDSKWIVKKLDWEADADNVPYLDFNGTASGVYINTKYIQIKNMEIKGVGGATGFYCITSQISIVGVLFKHHSSITSWMINPTSSSISLRRVTQEGNSHCYGFVGSFSDVKIKDSAFYGNSLWGIYASGGTMYLENVNSGVEVIATNPGCDLDLQRGAVITGRDVKTNDTHLRHDTVGQHILAGARIENWQRIDGYHVWMTRCAWYESEVLTTTPYPKMSDKVIKCNSTNAYLTADGFDGWAFSKHNLRLMAGTYTVKYWIYNGSTNVINPKSPREDFWLQARVLKSYDDSSEYVYENHYSTEIDIAVAADTNDWDYLSVTFTLFAESLVNIQCRVCDATPNNVRIDPLPIITSDTGQEQEISLHPDWSIGESILYGCSIPISRS